MYGELWVWWLGCRGFALPCLLACCSLIMMFLCMGWFSFGGDGRCFMWWFPLVVTDAVGVWAGRRSDNMKSLIEIYFENN